jgi:hypothetical protein
MKTNHYTSILSRLLNASAKLLFTLVALGFSFLVSAQKGNSNGTKDIVVRACVTNIGNGMYRVNFGYDNPNKKGVTVDEDKSTVKSNSGKNKTKGINAFKNGSVDKAFTMEFNEKDVVEWTVINPNGKVHTVIASANSSHCPEVEEGFIFPVYGQGNGKSDALVGLELTSLANQVAGDEPSGLIFQINDEQEVLIEITPQKNMLADAISLLTGTFGRQYNTDPQVSDFVLNPMVIADPANELQAIDLFFPIDRLLELNSYPLLLNFVRPLYPSYQNGGVVDSQGDAAQKSDIVRESFRIVRDGEVVAIDGSGQKIGVLSDSYNTQPFTGKTKAEVDVENGDLPGLNNINGYNSEIEVLKEFPFGTASDEGRAMMQILHDVAPGAALAFHTGAVSPRDFEVGVKALAAAGCDIIVDDLTFITESFFGSGRISNAIDSFTGVDGNFYFTSAGNFSNKGYQGLFTPSENTPTTNFLPSGNVTKAHIFGTNADGSPDIYQKINVVPGTYMIVLQWDEGLASQDNGSGALTDLDIYLVDDAGNLIVGNNRFNLNGDPTEIIVFQSVGTGEANLLITNASGETPPGLSFRYIAFQANGLEFLEYAGAPTISGHAMSPKAITVGAVDYRSAQNPQAQTFSSYGGTLANQALVEVDIAAPDGVNTNVASIGIDIEGDGFTNFFGTSAAAPHAAGAFALLMSALPSWYPDGLPINAPARANPSNDKALKLFKDTALAAGDINTAGAGLLNTTNAFLQIATQTPTITQLVVEDGKTPSAEPFQVTILGDYLPESPTVIFDGQELEIVSVTETEITALVNAFSGNPRLVVNVEGKTPGGTDGGDSNPLYFFDEGTYVLNIIANDASIEFGQAVDFSFSVEGLPEGVSIDSLGLPAIKIATPAVFPYPDVNNYNLQPYFETDLTEDQMNAFHINFMAGIFEVTKKDLVIRPIDATRQYGEAIDVEFNYDFIEDGIEDPLDFISLIDFEHESTFFETNTIALVNRFIAVVNDYQFVDLLDGGSWMASERTIQNRFIAVVNGMNIIDMEVDDLTNYFDAVNNPTTNRFIAVVNRFIAVVNGLALVNNQVDMSIENRFIAVVNESSLGGEDDTNDYSTVFALVDAEDASTDTEQRGVDLLYSLNMITGLGVTNTQDASHYVYPGSFLSPLANNFNTTYDYSRLNITAAPMQATISDFVVNDGVFPSSDQISAEITGFVYNETLETVFPDGLEYYFEDMQGNPYVAGGTGKYAIKISNPANYLIEYTRDAMVYINPFGDDAKKVRTYLDCVSENTNDPDGYGYTANLSYINPNAETFYVLEGDDNFVIGTAKVGDALPVEFLAGEHTFSIRFTDGDFTWSLTTLGSAHKTSVGSDSTNGSNRCEAKDVEATSSSARPLTEIAAEEELQQQDNLNAIKLYPNPVLDVLNINYEASQIKEIGVYDLSGKLYYKTNNITTNLGTLQLSLSAFKKGLYVVQVTYENEVKSYKVYKE